MMVIRMYTISTGHVETVTMRDITHPRQRRSMERFAARLARTDKSADHAYYTDEVTS